MKTLIAVLFITLTAGSLAGYYYGRLFAPWGIGKVMDDNTYLIGTPPYSDIHLSYICGAKPYATYSIRDKKIISELAAVDLFFRLAQKHNPDNLVSSMRKYIVGFVSGGGLVRFAAPIFRVLKSEDNKRYTIPGAISAASGFYFGYRLATLSLPACDNPGILARITDVDTWPMIVHLKEVSMIIRAKGISMETYDFASGAINML